MTRNNTPELFSDQLERWIKSKKSSTIASLIDAFEDKSFAILFVLLMILPALPAPTGGITHLLEVVVIIVAFEMILGLKTVWLPGWARRIKLGKSVKGKTAPLILKRIRWVEDKAKPKGVRFFGNLIFDRVIGVIVIMFTVTAFLAPPFTGLDTLPSLGVMLLGIAMIVEDIRLFILGVVTGTIGIILAVTLGAVAIEGARHLLGA